MGLQQPLSRREFALLAGGALLAGRAGAQQAADIPVPGTGLKVERVGDDFEDAEWSYIPNHPKSSEENDGRQRLPAGTSHNKRWFEPVLRGQPDMVKRIETPQGGVEGSTGALYLATFNAGVPGATSGKVEQDDFIANVMSAMGGMTSTTWQPNTVCRLYVPEESVWEKRDGATFGYRLGLRATHRKEGRLEEYWPGLLLRMETHREGETSRRYIRVTVRSNERGHDVPGPAIVDKGWYSLGMTCTANGAVHYFFKQGVEAFTAEDRIASYFPYGYRAGGFETFFFDVLVRDTGRTWSTPWVVDDAFMYLASPPRGFK